MRNWQCSAIAFTLRPVFSVIRSRKTSVGEAAYGSERTPAHAKARSATGVLSGDPLGAVAQRGEGGVDRGPRLLAAVEALPVQPEQPDQLVTDVERHEVGAEAAVDEERLDVRLDVDDGGVGGQHTHPGVQRKLGLGGAGRAGIEGDRAAHPGVAEEERHAYRDGQFVPIALEHREARVVAVTLGHRTKPADWALPVAARAALRTRPFVLEQQHARTAR